MRRSPALALILALALVPLALAACGDDDDSTTSPVTSPAQATETAVTEKDDAPAAGASTVEVAADPGGQLAYQETELTAAAGTVTIDFTNESSTPHDVQVEQDGEGLGGTEVISDSTATADLDLEAGEYTFYCSVAGHRDAGMEGTLTVE